MEMAHAGHVFSCDDKKRMFFYDGTAKATNRLPFLHLTILFHHLNM